MPITDLFHEYVTTQYPHWSSKNACWKQIAKSTLSELGLNGNTRLSEVDLRPALFTSARLELELASCISMPGRLWSVNKCIKMLTFLNRWTSPFLSDSFRLNFSISSGLHEGHRSDCDLSYQNISSLSPSSESCPVYPVSVSSWFCCLDIRDMSTPVFGCGEANPGLWPGGVIVLPTAKQQPDGAHTARDHSYAQRHAKVAIRGPASSTKYLFSRASPASLRPNFGLQHIPPSP